MAMENAHFDAGSFGRNVLVKAANAVAQADPALAQAKTRIAGTVMDLVTERGLPQNSVAYSKFRDALESKASAATGLDSKAVRLGADVAFRSVCEDLVAREPEQLGAHPTPDETRRVNVAQRARIALGARDSVVRAESSAYLTADPWSAPKFEPAPAAPSVLDKLNALQGNAPAQSSTTQFDR